MSFENVKHRHEMAKNIYSSNVQLYAVNTNFLCFPIVLQWYMCEESTYFLSLFAVRLWQCFS